MGLWCFERITMILLKVTHLPVGWYQFEFGCSLWEFERYPGSTLGATGYAKGTFDCVLNTRTENRLDDG